MTPVRFSGNCWCFLIATTFACRSQHHQNGQVMLIKLIMLTPHDKLVLSNWSFRSLDIKLDGRPLQSFSFAGFRTWSW